MKYKLLLTGKAQLLIDEIFNKMSASFEPMTSSFRMDDIINHLNNIKPDAFVYCPDKETRNYPQVASLKPKLSENHIPLIVIGTQEDCSEFQRKAANIADYVIERPLPITTIQSHIITCIELNSDKSMQKPSSRTRKNARQAAPASEDKILAKLLASVPDTNTESDPFFESDFFSEPASAIPTTMPTMPTMSDPFAERKHILVIDDDSRMLKVIKDHLHNKYDVATANSGRLAFKFLEKKSTNLILLDYEMPEENGPAVLQKLRENPATADIPVIFLTGISERSKIQKALALKPQGYLLKPIDRQKLFSVIENILD